MKTVKIIIAGSNANGEPDLFFVKVKCSKEDIDRGKHYYVAEKEAENNGYEKPFVTFDQYDLAGKALLPLFNWESASIIQDLT